MKTYQKYSAAVMGFGSGAAGLAASAVCAGGSCLSCFGCVAGGLGVLVAALAARGGAAEANRTGGRFEPARRKGDGHGMAESCR